MNIFEGVVDKGKWASQDFSEKQNHRIIRWLDSDFKEL